MNDLRISPSVLAADFACLGDQLQSVANADLLHIDMMDGHFVPNLSFGPLIAEAAARSSDLPLDVHLMVDNPEQYIEEVASLHPAFITVHYETTVHLHRILSLIRSLGAGAGVSLNPHTPVGWLHPILDQVDLILIMSVNPGFGGQEFIPASIDKIRQARELVGQRPIAIEVDGGISIDNTPALVTAGASILVAGSSIFRAKEPQAYIEAMRRAVRS